MIVDTLVPRRRFMRMLGGSFAVGLSGMSFAAAKSKPNIVFILIDDMGWHQIAANGNPFYETPHIDRLASQGLRFTNAYAAAPICSPTRASLMTGKYPARLHITDYIPGNPYPFNKLATPKMTQALPLDEKTLPEMLKQAGYVSGHFGKWHLNTDYNYAPGRPGDPASQGFDVVLTARKPEESETAQAGADPNYDAHHVREITDSAIAFMEANQDRPFFCYIPHNSIHRPVMEYGERIVKYAIKPEASNKMGNNVVIGAMVETLDTNIGRVLTKIDDLGIADNTIVVFYTDNGDLFGREGLKPFYGAKADLYEGGIRVPLIIRWPGVTKPGTLNHELVSSMDFFPTFAEAAGVSLSDPEIDGISILPAISGQGTLPRQTLFWHYPHYHQLGIAPMGAIRDGKYKLIEWFEKTILEGPEAEGALELFDLESDPGERNNLAKQMPEKTDQLYGKLRAWRKSIGAQEMTPNPSFDPSREGQKDKAG